MTRLKIRHASSYSYAKPVRFGTWRLLIRPIDTHANRLVEASLEAPPADIRWSYDAYGNCVCFLTPHEAARELHVVNHLVVDRYPMSLPGTQVIDPCSAIPIVYAMAERPVLQPFITPVTDDDDPIYRKWLQKQLPNTGELALDYLTRLTNSIKTDFEYGERWEEGTQGPAETVARNSGTCRDFAWLMIESVRRLGFAARFATGYLYSPGAAARGSGATHAWCEIFLPDLGWVEFDPTNGLRDSVYLIRVAATPTWREASPMAGSIIGDAACNVDVAVEVDVIDG